MQYKSLSVYRQGVHTSLQPFTFYILRVGNNAGKPLKEPCANCYVFSCESQQQYEYYYWLVYGLWQGKMFYPYHWGSVITFIVKSELKQVIETASAKIFPQYGFYKNTIKMVQAYENKSHNMLYQVKLLQSAKQVMLRPGQTHKYFKEYMPTIAVSTFLCYGKT